MEKITLHEAVKPEYFKKKVKFSCIVSGKSLIPYQIPKIIEITCGMQDNKKSCTGCSVKDYRGKIEIPPDIRFINTGEGYFEGVIAKILNIKCKFTFKVNEVYMIEELYINSPLSSKEENFSTSRLAYYIGYDIPCNTEIEVTGYTIPEPRQQKAVHIITDFKSVKSNIENFKMTRDLKKELMDFRPVENTVDSIYEKLEELYDIYSHNITKIYYRFDLHLGIDLVFHSPISFYLGNELIHKGWSDVMVLGDTRCGKGYVAENLMKYYNVGDMVSGENVSVAGLIGGVQQTGSKWILTWGKIPLNDKRLVIIDEAGDMDNVFQKLSRVRSEGIAEITKIKTEMSHARTRLLFLANPKNRNISSYTYGIEAVTDVITNAEDIARFDYVLIVANDEVSLEEINKKHSEIKNPYEELDNLLIRWIWSRKPDQIIMSEEVLEKIMEFSVKLGKQYSSQIPLIQGENIRVKMAKVAVSIAGRLFSASRDGECIVVKPEHVESAYVFFNMIYKKKSSSYYYYSKVKKEMVSVKDLDNLEKYIKSYANWNSIVTFLISSSFITPTDMSEYINQPKEIVREIISVLLKHCCIQKKYAFYVKNQEFNEWLKTIK